MDTLVVFSAVVALAASVGGLISIFTKKEMEQYSKYIFYTETILCIILSVFILSYSGNLISDFSAILAGAIFVILVNLLFPTKFLDRYVRFLILGMALGIAFRMDFSLMIFLAIIISIFNIIQGSRIGDYFFPRVNIFHVIGKFQAIFIIASVGGYFVGASVFAINFCAGALVATAFGNISRKQKKLRKRL